MMRQKKKDSKKYTKNIGNELGKRKILFAFVALAQIVHFLWFAFVHADEQNKLLICCGGLAVLMLLICVDKRKTHLTWDYIIIVCGIYFVFTALCIIRFQHYWHFVLLAIEALIFVLFSVVLWREGRKK